MDFSAITWAGNLYQKFEAMCLEVEEVMYQDTVKYVENQVQKVGVSVKKFYSDVMQDVLPTSTVDPAKVAADDSSLKKPKLSLLDSPKEELEEIETGDKAISELTSEKSSSLSGNNDENHGSAESCSPKSDGLGVNKHTIGIKTISRLDQPSEVSSPTASLTEPGSGNIECEKVIENTVLDASIDCPAPDKIMTAAESVRQPEDEFLGSSITSNLFEDEPIGELNAIFGKGKTNQDRSSLNTSVNVWDALFGVKEAAIYDEDEFDPEALEFADSVLEFSETFGKSNLEESCVLVDGNNLDFVLQGTKKQKSYKKKIREALKSKLRLARTQRFADSGGKMNMEVISPAARLESDEETLPFLDSLESEWELI